MAEPRQPVMSSAETAALDVLTMRDQIVGVRPVRPDDRAGLMSLYARASTRSRYLRFFSAAAAYEPEVTRLLIPQGDDHVALLAEHAEMIIAVASYERINRDEADFAMLVDDALQGEGIGTLLLKQLAATARRNGISVLLGDVLAANTAMLEVGTGVAPGVARRRDDDDPAVVQIRVPTQPDEAAMAAAGERDRTAEHRSLRPLFAPSVVAVIGAGRRPGGVGREILEAVLRAGYNGRVIPGQVDLAVIAVPAEAVCGVLEDCSAAGIGAAVVVTSGFSEMGSAGATAQAELVRVARTHGIRLVGPNCLGVINTDPAVRLDASFSPVSPPAGHLAIASQSGAAGIAALASAGRNGVGVSTFVSLGNKADVSTNDLLAYWYDDAATHAIALYVESFGNPRRFSWLAQMLSRRKPVLVVKSGRSPAGRRAGASHTAAAAAPDTAVDALFHQAGVIPTSTLGELLDAARLLTDQPLPVGDRLAIVGNARGLNTLAADAGHGPGLVIPDLSPDVARRIVAEAPWVSGSLNPLDLGAGSSPALLGQTVRTIATSGETDAVLVTLVHAATTSQARLPLLPRSWMRSPHCLLVVVAVGPEVPSALGQRRIPVYELPEDAVRALGHACRYAGWRRQPHGKPAQLRGSIHIGHASW